MVEKLIKKTANGSITSEEGIAFHVRGPNGGNITTHGKQIYAEDELNKRVRSR